MVMLDTSRLTRFYRSRQSKRPDHIDNGPVVTQQATVGGQGGTPLQILIAEVVVADTVEASLLSGLWEFLKARGAKSETAADIAVEQLTAELKKKAEFIGADAVVNVAVSSTRGVEQGGQRRARFTAVGTAIQLDAIGRS